MHRIKEKGFFYASFEYCSFTGMAVVRRLPQLSAMQLDNSGTTRTAVAAGPTVVVRTAGAGKTAGAWKTAGTGKTTGTGETAGTGKTAGAGKTAGTAGAWR